MRVLLICNEKGISEFFRALTPYRLLAEAGEIELTQDSGRSPAIIDHLDEFQAVVFSRPDSAEYSLILSEAKGRGLRTVVDVDDNLLLIPPSIGVYYAWHERGTGRLQPRAWYFKRNVRLADVLTVSTAALGRQLCDGQPHRLRAEGDYLVLENMVLAEEWGPGGGGQESAEALVKPPGEIWVGWWGIYNHWDDWRDIAPYIEPVIAERPNVKLVLLGMPELSHLFPRLRQTGQLIIGPFVEMAEIGPYRELVKQFDVALAPTAAYPFNEAKSDLKVLQYGAAGVPAVIASAVTYLDWREEAVVLSSPTRWGDALAVELDQPRAAYPNRQWRPSLQERVLGERTYEGNFRRWLAALGS